jgi:hypothetical protein
MGRTFTKQVACAISRAKRRHDPTVTLPVEAIEELEAELSRLRSSQKEAARRAAERIMAYETRRMRDGAPTTTGEMAEIILSELNADPPGPETSEEDRIETLEWKWNDAANRLDALEKKWPKAELECQSMEMFHERLLALEVKWDNMETRERKRIDPDCI